MSLPDLIHLLGIRLYIWLTADLVVASGDAVLDC